MARSNANSGGAGAVHVGLGDALDGRAADPDERGLLDPAELGQQGVAADRIVDFEHHGGDQLAPPWESADCRR